ncbi:MAG: hypothetical protein ACOCXR_02945 [Phototrophicaceae bacterium]
MELTVNPQKLLRSLIGVTFVLAVLALLGIGQIWDERFLVFSLLFELNSHITISTWYALILFLIAAIFAGFITLDHTQRRQSFTRHWGYLTIVFVLMCIDEFANLHNLVLNGVGDFMGGGDGIFYYAWVIPGLLIVAGFALFFLPFFIRMPPTPRNGIAGGLALFVFGAVGAEMITSWFISNYDLLVLHVLLLTTVEELTEKIGMCVVIWGLAHYLRDHTAIRIRLDSPPA